MLGLIVWSLFFERNNCNLIEEGTNSYKLFVATTMIVGVVPADYYNDQVIRIAQL